MKTIFFVFAVVLAQNNYPPKVHLQSYDFTTILAKINSKKKNCLRTRLKNIVYLTKTLYLWDNS